MKHLIAEDSVTRGPLFLELGEDTCFVGIDPLRGHAFHDPVTVTVSLPERNDLIFVYMLYLVTDLKRHFWAVIENIKILKRVKADLGLSLIHISEPTRR